MLLHIISASNILLGRMNIIAQIAFELEVFLRSLIRFRRCRAANTDFDIYGKAYALMIAIA